ncbi:MAG: hypothetical protein ACM3MN_09030, partial [Nitrospirota bacterium]
MKSTCSLHCGNFAGVTKGDFKKIEKFLRGLFDYVYYVPEAERLELTGAREIEASPQQIISVFNRL